MAGAACGNSQGNIKAALRETRGGCCSLKPLVSLLQLELQCSPVRSSRRHGNSQGDAAAAKGTRQSPRGHGSSQGDTAEPKGTWQQPKGETAEPKGTSSTLALHLWLWWLRDCELLTQSSYSLTTSALNCPHPPPAPVAPWIGKVGAQTAPDAPA